MTVAYFTNIEKIILSNLENAKNSIKIAVAWFSNPDIFNALLRKRKEGVSVELIMADDIINFSKENINFQLIIDSGGEIRISKYPRLMHNKFCVFDNKILISGSYNWTISAEKLNFENIIVSTDKNLINSFVSEFDNLKSKTLLVVSIQDTDFHKYSNDLEFTSATDQVEILLDSNLVDEELGNNDGDKNEISLESFEDELHYNDFKNANLAYCQADYASASKIIEKILQNASKLSNEFLSDLYRLASEIKWREKKYAEQIKYAQKAIEFNNENYSAYNMLGIAYAEKKYSNSEKARENYDICIEADSKNYIYYFNRALSFKSLAADSSVLQKVRDISKHKAEIDLEETIKITDDLLKEDISNYNLFAWRGRAKHLLDKHSAQEDLKKAQRLFDDSPIEEQDIHIKREIDETLKDIEYQRKI